MLINLEEVGPISERVREKVLSLSPENYVDVVGNPRRRKELQLAFHMLYKKTTYIFQQWLGEAVMLAGETGLPTDFFENARTYEGDVAALIVDPAGAEFWGEKIKSYMVTWKKLKNDLEIRTQVEISDDLENKLRRVLDFSDSGMVNALVFNEFLLGFGPFEGLIARCEDILGRPWFQGYSSLQEATRLLDVEQPGSFLLRLRDCSAGLFAIAFVHPELVDKVVHVAVKNDPNGGFLIQQGNHDLHFDDINAIIRTYARFLCHPFTSRLNEQGWFYGDISGREATELLRGQTVASYLVRFSQGYPNCLATAYVSSDGEIVHSLIEKSREGYRHRNDPSFPTLAELLHAYQAVLSFPFISSNTFYEELAQKAAKTVDVQHVAPPDTQASSEDLSDVPEEKAEEYAYPIPLIAEQCILYLCDRKNASTPDLFKASRSAQEVNEMKQMFEKNIDIDVWTYHPHSVAQLLKVYLREMPSPLVPENLFPGFVEITAVTPVEHVAGLLASLPDANRKLLAYLMRMATIIVADAARNNLTAAALAQQLGPNILRRHDMSMEDSLQFTEPVCKATQFLVENAVALMPEVESIAVDGIYYQNLLLTPNRHTIKSGTLDQLVRALYAEIPGASIRSATYGAKFRLTFSSFITPQQLMRMIIDTCAHLTDRPELEKEAQNRVKIQRQKLISFTAKWVMENTDEFEADKKLSDMVSELLGSVTEPMLRKHLTSAQQRIGRTQSIVATFATPAPASKKLPKKFSSAVELPTVEVARQLTLVMYDLYSRIRPNELLEVRWQKGSDADRQARAGNVLAVSTHYNKTVNWVSTEILQSKSRPKAISFFISLAEELRGLNNFNGVYAVVSAFASAAVARLNEVKSLKRSEQMKLNDLKAYLNTTNNYKYYRDALKKANPPIVPYLGIFLTDLLMIHEGNKIRLSDDHINFRKCYATAIVIQNVQQYQQSPYNLTPVTAIQEFMASFVNLSEDDAWSRSQQIQPSQG